MEKEGDSSPSKSQDGGNGGTNIAAEEESKVQNPRTPSPNRGETTSRGKSEAEAVSQNDDKLDELDERLSGFIEKLEEMGPTISRYQYDEKTNEVDRLANEMKAKAMATMIMHLQFEDIKTSTSGQQLIGPTSSKSSKSTAKISPTYLELEQKLKQLEKESNKVARRIKEHKREQAHTLEKIQNLEAMALLDEKKNFVKDLLLKIPTEADLQNLENICLMLNERKRTENRIQLLKMRTSALDKAMAAAAKAKWAAGKPATEISNLAAWSSNTFREQFPVELNIHETRVESTNDTTNRETNNVGPNETNNGGLNNTKNEELNKTNIGGSTETNVNEQDGHEDNNREIVNMEQAFNVDENVDQEIIDDRELDGDSRTINSRELVDSRETAAHQLKKKKTSKQLPDFTRMSADKRSSFLDKNFPPSSSPETRPSQGSFRQSIDKIVFPKRRSSNALDPDDGKDLQNDSVKTSEHSGVTIVTVPSNNTENSNDNGNASETNSPTSPENEAAVPKDPSGASEEHPNQKE